MKKLRLLTTSLLVFAPVVAALSAIANTNQPVAGECYFNCTTQIPGFPVESIGGGLLLGFLIILLLRGIWHVRKPMVNLLSRLLSLF